MSIPVEPISVGEYLRDELEARGWTTRDCAERMGGDADVYELALDLIVEGIYPESRLSLDEARGIARAFGHEPATWMRLDEAYHAAVAAKKVRTK